MLPVLRSFSAAGEEVEPDSTYQLRSGEPATTHFSC